MILSAKTTSKMSIFRLAYILLFLFAFTSCVDLSERRDETAGGAGAAQQGEGGSAASEEDETTPDAPVSSADFEGKYEGTVPCEDCEGIETEIVINNNQTFKITSNYLGKNKKTEDNGRFEILEEGSIIHLKGKDTDLKLKVDEDKLYQLDTDDQVIEGENAEHFIYHKK